MAGRDSQWSEESESPPNVTNVREYSDAVLYMCKAGRFQAFALLDENRRKGVLSMLTSQRVTKLSQQRRLSPVLLTLTPGEREQRVYIFSIIRSTVTLEELTDYVDRLNNHLDGLTSQEKENAVIDLIPNTPARVIPGVRSLPVFFYNDDEEQPQSAGSVDRDNLPIVATDDETMAVRESKSAHAKRGKKHVSFPSTSSNLPAAHTDTEKSKSTTSSDMSSRASASLLAAKKRMNERREKSKDSQADDEASDAEPMPKRTRSGATAMDVQEGPGDDDDNFFVDYTQTNTDSGFQRGDEQNQTEEIPRPTSLAEQGAVVLSWEQYQNLVQKVDQKVSTNAFREAMDDITTRLTSLKDVCDGLAQFRAGAIDAEQLASVAGVPPPRERIPQDRQRATSYLSYRSAASSEPGPAYNEAESRLRSCFPIVVYTEAMDWLLRQEMVKKYLRFETIRLCYTGLPKSKSDWETVASKFFDFVVSIRMQCHLGKATNKPGSGPAMDFGRFPLPQPIIDVATERLGSLHRVKIDGDSTYAQLFKGKCVGYKRTQLLASPHMIDAESIQLMAQRFFWERIDFFRLNRRMMRSLKESDWTFEKELAKTKKLTGAKNKTDDKDFVFNPTVPDDIQNLVFKDMRAGRVVQTMEEAQAIVQDLHDSGLTRPILHPDAWDMVNTVVYPTEEEVLEFRRKTAKKSKTHDARLVRRRAAYKEKHPTRDVDDDDESADDDDAHDSSFNRSMEEPPVQQQDEAANTPENEPETQTQTDEPGNVTWSMVTREQIFGPMSTSSESNNQEAIVANVNQEGVLVFAAPPELENQPATTTMDAVDSAVETALTQEGKEATVTASRQTQQSTVHTVAVNDPKTTEEPTVIQSRENVTVQQAKQVKVPASKTTLAMRRYADAEEDFPSFSSTSSSSSSERDKVTPAKRGGSGAKGSGKKPGPKKSDFQTASDIMKSMGPPTSAPWKASKPKKYTLAKGSPSSSKSDNSSRSDESDEDGPPKKKGKSTPGLKSKGKGKKDSKK